MLSTVALIDSADIGCVTVPDAVMLHWLEYFTVTVYVPGPTPDTLSVLLATGDQLYVYPDTDGVPPVTVTTTLPLPAPLHRIFLTDTVAESGSGWLMTTLSSCLQPLQSVMITRYVPPGTFERFWVVSKFDHRYVYGRVPPFTVNIAEPLLAPAHVTLVAVTPDVITVGLFSVTLRLAVQPLASITVTVYVPADSPLIDDVVCTLPVHA